MNWGYKILTVYIIFVAGIIFLVFKSSSQNQDLVTPDYYEQELKFQGRIDEIERANALSTPVTYNLQGHELNLFFPQEMKGKNINASLLLYCTTDKSKDIEKKLTVENGKATFTIPPANKGSHELKLSWSVNGNSYYYQHKLILP